MVACFGLHNGYQLRRVPADLLVESWPRLDIWMLLQHGALLDGVTTELRWGEKHSQLAIHGPDLLVDGTRIAIVWDEPMPGVGRPWFECPRCSRRCRHVYLRDMIACRQCHGLQHACLHLRRQTPAVGRVERLRRKLGDCDARPFAPLPAHIRRGRSRAYHDRLVAQILDEEAKLIGHLQTVTNALERRIRIRKARGEW